MGIYSAFVIVTATAVTALDGLVLRMCMHPTTYTGLFQTIAKTKAEEGISGFFKGLVPNIFFFWYKGLFFFEEEVSVNFAALT